MAGTELQSSGVHAQHDSAERGGWRGALCAPLDRHRDNATPGAVTAVTMRLEAMLRADAQLGEAAPGRGQHLGEGEGEGEGGSEGWGGGFAVPARGQHRHARHVGERAVVSG